MRAARKQCLQPAAVRALRARAEPHARVDVGGAAQPLTVAGPTERGPQAELHAAAFGFGGSNFHVALEEYRGNRRKAAEVLGIGERTLYRKIKAFGLG